MSAIRILFCIKSNSFAFCSNIEKVKEADM